MKLADNYLRFIQLSEEDQCYIGYCRDLFFGSVYHGEGEEETCSN